MPKTVYEDLILSLISEKELVIERDEYFNPASFRSAFYRFKNSDIGLMMLRDCELKMKSEYEDEVELVHITLIPHLRPAFKIRSVPNGPTV